MIQQQTLLNVSDNSGAKIAKCIKVLGGFKKKIANIGDIVTVTVYKLRDTQKISKVKKGQIYRAIVIRTKKSITNYNTSNIFFSDNAVILLDKQNNFIANRIIGPVPKKIKRNNAKISLLTNNFI